MEGDSSPATEPRSFWNQRRPQLVGQLVVATYSFNHRCHGLDHRHVLAVETIAISEELHHPALVAHLKHARRSPNRYGVSVWKGHRESSRKIDLAVCFIGARMLRRQFLNTTATRKTGKQAGRAW